VCERVSEKYVLGVEGGGGVRWVGMGVGGDGGGWSVSGWSVSG
jgi:hypothetical protein